MKQKHNRVWFIEVLKDKHWRPHTYFDTSMEAVNYMERLMNAKSEDKYRVTEYVSKRTK